MHASHLAVLESEAIHIFREVAAEFDKPVMLYSVGKDSSVLLHLARKAFYPAKIPFPLLHIDTTWKFAEMIAFRDRNLRGQSLKRIPYRNFSSSTQAYRSRAEAILENSTSLPLD